MPKTIYIYIWESLRDIITTELDRGLKKDKLKIQLQKV